MSNPTQRRRDHRPPDSSPYGPQPHGIDVAAGGADSSPFENEPSGDKAEAARKATQQQQPPTDDGGDWCI